MLKVEKLSVAYAGVTVLREVSLTVNDGEIVSVVGANGGGGRQHSLRRFRDF